MTRHIKCLLLSALVLAVAQPALGQSLADRLEAVRRQRAEQEARARQQADTQANAQRRMLQELFYTNLTIDFDKTPARDVFNFIDDAIESKLMVRSSEDAIGHGIDLETEITLELENVPVIDVLEQVLEQCSLHESCTWQLRKSFIEVGTKDRLGTPAAQYVKMYPVDDLLFEPPDFEGPGPMDLQSLYARQYAGFGPGYINGPGGFGGAGGSITPAPAQPKSTTADNAQELVEVIQMTIEPEAWTTLGGNWASIRYFEGVLIVRAPEFVHRQIGGYPRIPPPPAAESAASSAGGG